MANEVLASDARHIMLFGGSRSGKTFLLIRAIVMRAIAAPSRHAVLRFRFNHVKASVILQTLPDVMARCFPGVGERSHLDKQDWFYAVPSDGGGWSEIWFGGLDDKERTEKILGQEYASLFLNECSQIPWASRNMAVTRLAQKTGLRLKAYYDCNPPSEGHWTHKLFIARRHPDTKLPLKDPAQFASFGPMNPRDNIDNLPDGYLQDLETLPERMKRRFLLGQWGAAAEAALWTPELLDQSRRAGSELPAMQRVVIAVDPSGCAGPEDTRSDEIGIVVGGLGADGRGYVLEDLSGRYGPGEWGRLAVSAFDRHDADAIVAEGNFGGAMVEEIIRAASREGGATRAVPVRLVSASRGKVVRAEPVAALFEQGKAVLAGHFPLLEDQLSAMTQSGYAGDRSPDRADAMVWLFAHLFPALTRKDDASASVPRVVLAYAAAKEGSHPGGVKARPVVVMGRR